MVTSYRPGEWIGVVGPRATVLLPPTEKARAGALWALVDDGAEFDTVLDSLVSTGLSNLPGFVLLASEGPDDAPVTRVMIRGGASAVVESDEGTVELTGSTSTTWVERRLTGVTQLTVDVAEGATDAAPMLVDAGMVRVSRIEVPPVAAGPSAGSSPASSAPAAAPSGAAAGGPTAPPAPLGAALSVVPDADDAPSAGDDHAAEGADAEVEEEGAEDAPGEGEPTHDEADAVTTPDPLTDPYLPPVTADAEAAQEDEESTDTVDDSTDLTEADLDVPAEDEAATPPPPPPFAPPAVPGGPTMPPPPGPPPTAAPQGPPPGPAQGPPAGPPPGAVPPPPPAPPAWTPPPPPPLSDAGTDEAAEAADVPADDLADDLADEQLTEQLPVVGQEPPVDPAARTEAMPPAPPAAPPAAPEGDNDHDGLTQIGTPGEEFARQHPGIPGQPSAPSVTAFPVARLEFSSGERVDVDRVVIVGRAPEASRFTATEQPMLVTVPSPNQEISSTHVEIRPGSGVDHGAAVVTDLGSTNGTVLVQPGLGPEELPPGMPVQLMPGAIVDLGDGLTIRVLNA